jgi:flagellar hook-associated protein 2
MTAITSPATTLDSTYQSLIDYEMQLESQPLTNLQTQQTALQTQRAVYTDLKTKLDGLRSSAKTLMSTDPFYSLKTGRTAAVTNIDPSTTVITAATSSAAIPASYDIANISLALADRVKSDQQEYSDQALNKSGTICIGGSTDRSAVKNLQAVNGFGTGTVADGNTKLSDGSYFVETRKNGSNWEFRLVNNGGTAQTINGSGTDGWQSIPTSGGTYDTGRGLTIDFGTDSSTYVASSKSYGSAANVSFTSQDTNYSISNVQNTATTALNTVADIKTNGTLASGQTELGNGTYYVETQKNTSGVWQFRLVDTSGTAAKIAQIGGTTSTTAWQNIPTGGGTYSTGRGLDINFGTDSSKYVAKSKLSGASSVNYQAKAATVNVTSDMSLNDIAYAINSSTFATGNEVVATVVDKQLVLSSKNTGIAHHLQASGSVLQDLGILSGSSYKNVMQSARDATFTVNGLSVTRSQNSAITDVISGVTLNLASDAQDKSATLTISSDNSAAKNAITSFVTNFNSLQSYLTTKMAVTKQSDGTYLRGALSGDVAIRNLHNKISSLFNSYDSTATVYKSLNDIGITLDGSMNATISNSTTLDTALKTNFSDVQTVINRVMSSINTELAKYSDTSSGSTSYVDQMIKANDTKNTSITSEISSWTTRLAQSRTSLTNMYLDAQSQLDELNNTQSTNTAWINSMSSLINTYG